MLAQCKILNLTWYISVKCVIYINLTLSFCFRKFNFAFHSWNSYWNLMQIKKGDVWCSADVSPNDSGNRV